MTLPTDDRALHAHLIGRQGGRADINSPALVVDLDVLDANIAAMAATAPSAGSSISVSPSSGLVDGAWVAVTFSSASPAATDLVLAYAPLPANLSATAPVEWFSPSAVDPAYLSTGTGALPARLVNMRAPYTFVLATGGLARPVAVAVSQPVASTSTS